MDKVREKRITLDFTDRKGKTVGYLDVFSKGNSEIYENSPDEQKKYSEEKYLLAENQRYEFEIKDVNGKHCRLCAFNNSVVTHSSRDEMSGDIEPGNYTGLLTLYLVDKNDLSKVFGTTSLEVISLKIDSREHYRIMLDYIAKQSADLIMQLKSPVRARFSPDKNIDIPTISQRFYFLKSLLSGRHFNDAVHQILRTPHIRSESKYIDKSLIKGGFRLGSQEIRQITSRYPRVKLPENHNLYDNPSGLRSLPQTVTTVEQHDYLDTPENRFVKHALNHFLMFLDKMGKQLDKIITGKNDREKNNSKRLQSEIQTLKQSFQNILSHSFFKEISHLRILPLGSPVLQRKEGYRELLRAWLKFNTAAKLVWEGGNDVFNAGKRDIAKLYEYWLFFKLLEVFCEKFNLTKPLPKSLIETTGDNFGLKLKAGKELKDITGEYKEGKIPLKVRLSYNTNFIGNKKYDTSGSWTMNMQPDYTITLWPLDMAEPVAIEKEQIVHLHFDAKYKIHGNHKNKPSDLIDLFGRTSKIREDDENKTDTEEKLTAKRIDLLKMHAYKDAIKRSEGAYILYPGNKEKKWMGYKELLPGIGAFPVYPGEKNLSDMKHVEDFLSNVVLLCQDKFSQLRKMRESRYHILAERTAQYGLNSNTASEQITENRNIEAQAVNSMTEPPPINVNLEQGQFDFVPSEPPFDINKYLIENRIPNDQLIPFINLEATASPVEHVQSIETDIESCNTWLKYNGRWDKDCFVMRVAGGSMEPKIPNGSYCLFRRGDALAGSCDGRIMLVLFKDDEFTTKKLMVKQYYSEKAEDEFGNVLHAKIELRSRNRAYPPIVFTEPAEDDVRIIGEFVKVIDETDLILPE